MSSLMEPNCTLPMKARPKPKMIKVVNPMPSIVPSFILRRVCMACCFLLKWRARFGEYGDEMIPEPT
ncbi:hypothetical protein ACAN107058_23415 [Paracidovorax anthurii]